MLRVVVLKNKVSKTVHIFDSDNREVVILQGELPGLIKLLRKAARAPGIPREQYQKS
jgi:hypothetical protein